MRALLFLPTVFMASCCYLTDHTSYATSQREILKRAQVEIEQREPWSSNAAIFVTNPGEVSRYRWKVRAGALDYSSYHPVYKGTYFVPGTERELCFSTDGCLLRYSYAGGRCAAPITADSGGMLMLPEK